MKKIFKTITALMLSAAVLAPAGNLPLTVSAAACEAEHECAEHSDEELKTLVLEEYGASTLKAPTASRKSGTISCAGNSTTVKLSAAKGTIYYSLNGAAYKKYTAAIKLTKNSTVKAYAQSGSQKSETVTFDYKLLPSVTFDVTDTESGKLVKLTTKVSGVKFYYTTDNKKPTTSSKLYTSSGITISQETTLRVLAVKSGWSNANFTKIYKISTSSSSSDTKQLGASSFTTPSTGKATLRYNGSTKTVDASHSAGAGFDRFIVKPSSEQYIGFTITSGAKFNNGDTLTLSDMNGYFKGSGWVSVAGFDLQSGSKYTNSNSDTKMFDKVEIKAVDMDYTGAKPSTIYFYVLAHDESGKEISLEGLAKVNIKDSKRDTSSGSGSGSSGSGSGSTGTSSSSYDTKQLGASSFTTPSTGKATLRYNGSTKTVNASHLDMSEYDIIYVKLSSKKFISFAITTGAKFNNGDTLTLSDMNGLTKGSGYVSVTGFDLQSNSTTSSQTDAKMFDKVEIKAVDMDYTGAKPSTIYYYVLVHDESGKKTSFEGLAKVNIKDSKRDTASGSGSGNSGTDTSSRPKPMDVSEFTDLKIPAEAGKVYTDENKECSAKYKFEGAPASSADTYTVYFDKVSYTDQYRRNRICYPQICIGIDTTVKFETGDTLYLSDFTGEKSASNIIFSNFYHWNGLNSAQQNRDHCASIGWADRFKKVVVKAVDMDYTGENPSVIYYYIQLDSWTFEGIIKVNIDADARSAPIDMRCQSCFGDGLCSNCHGTGTVKYITFKPEYTVKFDTCPICRGKKTCQLCLGTGVRG